LNVSTDLSYFQYIVPCGLTKPVTSMAALGVRASLHEVGQTLAAHFGRVFDCEMGEPIHD
jgi:lipoyl(octanoyl) transferase